MRAPAPCSEPYKDLFIYYIKGRVRGIEAVAGAGFIGNWEEDDDSFLFFHHPADELVHNLLRRRPHLALQDRFHMAYDEWHGGAPASIRVGRLQVVPPWHPGAARPASMTILLDPGVVFGTGTHPTTHDCLAALQLAFGNGALDRVLDVGTGTGLLALAAAKLGAGTVVAVDLNRLAAETAQCNVRLNRMAGRVLVVQGDALNFMDLPSDLMVSNIHYDVMRRMIAAGGFARHKRFILSGLLRSQARETEHQLRLRKVRIVKTWERDGIWHTIYGRTETARGSD